MLTLFSLPTSLLALISLSLAQNIAVRRTDVTATAATALTLSPTSNVPGKAFDRFVVIWLENTDYPKAVGDPNLSYLASKGITLSSYCAVTHPSEPNHIAAVGGDTFGCRDDELHSLPANISSIVDLLEDKGISWGEYQEDMPYTGFEGYAWRNQQNGANDYVRKHNPLVMYESVTTNPQRLACLKNLTMLYKDLDANQLPQWMFITPNMTNDGHDTSVTTAGAWTRSFLAPLMSNPSFMNNTLILITWDENHTYSIQNRVLGILLGDVVPADLVGTTDSTIYTHYSEIATVEANWDLHTLGRYDVGANVFSLVAQKTGDTLRNWTGSPSFDQVHLSKSYVGPLKYRRNNGPWPEPNTLAVVNGRSVLPSIVDTWSSYSDDTYYSMGVEVADAQHPPILITKEKAATTTTEPLVSDTLKSVAMLDEPQKSNFFTIICGFAFAILGWRDFD